MNPESPCAGAWSLSVPIDVGSLEPQLLTAHLRQLLRLLALPAPPAQLQQRCALQPAGVPDLL